MLKKRIIACLDIKNGKTVKGINFKGLRDAGNPVVLAKKYTDQGIDELVFLDISATQEKRKPLTNLIEKVAQQINIPFTVGGGITTVQDAAMIIAAGADKVSINSSAIKNPKLINDLAAEFGSQCVVVAIDTKSINYIEKVFINSGKVETEKETLIWAKEVQELGAGEILLTSMNTDGTKTGFSLDITQQISKLVSIPVIASGGAGKMEDFKQVFKETDASGALAASVFHFGQISIQKLKQYLTQQNIPVRDGNEF